jgi:hypothetical protein
MRITPYVSDRPRSGGGEHQIHVVLQDQLRGHLTGAIRLGLAVLDQDLHRTVLAAHRQTRT